MTFREFLADNTVVTDGAMGTYFSQISGSRSTVSELANIDAPHIVRQIHDSYIDAGAQLIRTNTFSANPLILNKTQKEIDILIDAAYSIGRDAVTDGQHKWNHPIFLAAVIGPVPEVTDGVANDEELILTCYENIAQKFLDLGADIFVFETFGSAKFMKQVSEYIKSRKKNAFILVEFAINSSGYTHHGIGMQTLISNLRRITTIDSYGFNCGIGPAHLCSLLKSVSFGNDIVSAIPNAGYPEIVNEQSRYTSNPEYFASKIMDIKDLGVKIIGGCCGTTPTHIQQITNRLNAMPAVKLVQNTFAEKLDKKQFVIAVELDPPSNTKISALMDGAKVLRDAGVDLITLADSPLCRPRADAIIMAAKIKREIGIDAMPHLCCRDKNVIGLQSLLLGAYMEDIRNLLIVTGDAIPSSDRNDIKSVFNLNSVQLMSLASEMNLEKFDSDPFIIGGALNININGLSAELTRVQKKIDAGAKFLLTQPVYNDEQISHIHEIRTQKDIKILAGIMPIVSLKNAMFLDNEVPGISIPNEVIKRFTPDQTREESEAVGVELALEIAQKVTPFVDGLYFITPFNRAGMIAQVLKMRR